MTGPAPDDVLQYVARTLDATITDNLIRLRYNGQDYQVSVTGPPPHTTGGGILEQILEHVNAARADAGAGPLTLDDTLNAAAAAHTALMAAGTGLTHQGAGEPRLGDRLTAAGSRWKRCAENVGYTSTGRGDDALIRAANQMTDRMLAETSPGDGHRRNLLNPAHRRCGLAVQRTAGIAWMTQDFTD